MEKLLIKEINPKPEAAKPGTNDDCSKPVIIDLLKDLEPESNNSTGDVAIEKNDSELWEDFPEAYSNNANPVNSNEWINDQLHEINKEFLADIADLKNTFSNVRFFIIYIS